MSLALLLLALGWTTPSQAKTVYFQPNSNWQTDGARFALYMFGGANDAWTDFAEVDAVNHIYKATFDDSQTNMIFCRMNGSSTENIWDNRWNQSDNLAAPTADNLLYTITEGRWGKDSGGNENGKIADGDGLTTEAYTEPVAAGYTVDFNTAITTSNHDFAVAKGWSHIVPNSDYDGYGPYYMSYSYYASMGVDGTGALWAGRQYAGDNSGGEVVKDILVTPLVNGTITLDVKAYSNASSSNPAFVEVYAINADGTLGSLLKTVKEDIAAYNGTGTADWATFTLAELTAEQKLGLRCQYEYIDNFTAASVNIPAERKLEVTKVANLEGATGTSGTTTYFEQQADGTLKVQLQVTLTNTGDYDFAAGDEGYTLTLASATYASGSKTYYDDATVNISEALAAGESKTIDVDFFIPFSTGWKYFFVRENITGTTSSSNRYAGVTAYESKFVFRAAGTTSTSSISTAEAWGTITTSTTKGYEIVNTGTAPLTIKSVTLPQGFTSDNAPTAEFTLAKGETQALNITQDASAMGTFSGTLAIVYLDKDNAEQTYNLGFSATVIGANTWTADFNNTTSTPIYPAGSVAEIGLSSDYQSIGSNNYNVWLQGGSATENNKFITPKLHAGVGDQLTYDVKGAYAYGSSTYYAKVFVSTDRQNWQQVAYYTAKNVDGAENIGYSEWKTRTVTFDNEGDYYVAFALYGNFAIDNLVGLEKVDVAHDLYIKSVSWPNAYVNSGVALSKPSVDFVPLTDETAANYTVKYVCGSTVLAQGTPIDLTASATSSKTIAFSWTPVVGNTTTFTGTKVVFDFGGGVTIESEAFDLTVANEPKFHFLNSAPANYQEPSDRTAPITFGKTNTADTQNFVIYNWGSAPLTVNSISLPAGFTTTTQFPLTVAAFNGENSGIAASCQALDITFSATAPGDYSGNMVITYSGDQTFSLPISGTKLDPTKFYATFGTSSDASNYPAGSLVQSNVSINTPTTGNGALVSSNSNKNLFITPKLTTTGENVQFDAKVRSPYYSGSVKVYSVTDNKAAANTANDEEFEALNPTLLGEFTIGTDVTSFTSYSVAAPAGEYYLAFKIADVYVDEIYGMTVVPLAHDLQIASSNIPAQAMQNVASTATVNILNLGLADEAADSYTVTAYVNGVAAGTGSAVAIPMSHMLNEAGTQLSVSYMSNVVGTFPVYLEVKAGEYSVVTDPVDVTFVEEVATGDAIVVGTSSGSDRSHAIIDFYNLDGGDKTSDIVYTADQLKNFGISSGATITSISFKGTAGYNLLNSNNKLTAWVGMKKGDITPNNVDATTKANMIERLIFDGSVSNDVSNLTIDLTGDPIIFDGESDLRVYIEGTKGSWASVSYDYDNNYKNMYWSNGSGALANPLVYITLAAQSATLSGTVTTSGREAIEGATVTLKAANGVEYSGTTDATGAYSINVIQAGLDFTATVEAVGYLKRQFALNMNGASATSDVTMYQQYGIVGAAEMGLDWDNDAVMTQSADDPMVFTLELNNVDVVKGNYNYKLRADGIWQNPNTNNGYDIPSYGNGNQTAIFPADGKYNLLFTADVANHTLDLDIVVAEYILAERACEGTDNPFEQTLPIAALTVKRTFNAGWNAVCLPFVLTQDEITSTFGAGSEVAFFNGDEVNGNSSVKIKFDKFENDLEANKPYLIWVATAVTDPVFANKTLVDPNNAELKADAVGTCYDFMGTYVKIGVPAGDMFIKNGGFVTATNNNHVRAFRSYLMKKDGQGARSVSIFIDGEEVTTVTPTGIDSYADDTTIDGNVYNLNGQRVSKTSKRGVYIVNGKKVAVK